MVGGTEPLPAPARLAGMVRNRASSVIADLSLLRAEQKIAYCRAAVVALTELRRDHGLPHWIVVEEADQLLPGGGLRDICQGADPQGYCLVTHRPLALGDEVLATLDAVLALPGAEQYAQVPLRSPAPAATASDHTFTLRAGQALIATRDAVRTFDVSTRVLPHVRHQHKYAYAQVPAQRRFFFGPNGTARRAAGNVSEFGREIAHASDTILRAHLRAGDFSRWVREVLADDDLGARLRNIERWFQNEPRANIEPARTAIVEAIDERYRPDRDG
jgi:hypothetical protein